MSEALSIPGLSLYRPRRHDDARGYFVETWSERVFSADGRPGFVQDNEVFSAAEGTVRGLHFQTPPFAQAKLLRCIAGAVFDVVVDIRRGSPTYGKHVGIELRPNTGSLFMPAGVAHGYCSLVPDTLVLYKVSAPYAPEHEGGIAWDDPALEISWPIDVTSAILSERDKRLPRLADLQSPFVYAPSRA
jgi:dTDP-4-dehydrorhamnose 3,5-epimerase